MIQKVNLKENVNSIDGLFLYKRVGTMNNHMLNVLQAEHGTLDFHIHENSDELFYPKIPKKLYTGHGVTWYNSIIFC